MKVFVKKLLVFVLPLSVLFIFPSVVLIYGREYFSYKDVLQHQTKFPESLFGFAYNGASFYPYKVALTDKVNPEVVALGTSKVMQIRKEFFKDETLFVNAGGAGKTLSDIESFVRGLPEDGATKVIILGLEEDYFTAPHAPKEKRTEYILPLRFMITTILMSRRMYLDYINHKYSLHEVVERSQNSHNIGLSALLHNDGFRSDGSYQYSEAQKNPERISYLNAQVEEKREDMIRRQNSFKGATRYLDDNLETLRNILTTARDKNILVIGFIPPMPSALHSVYRHNQPSTSLTTRVAHIFDEAQMSFFDVSDIALFGGKGTEFVDTVHGTDVMYAKMLLYIMERSPLLARYIHKDALRKMIEEAQGDFLNF